MCLRGANFSLCHGGRSERDVKLATAETSGNPEIPNVEFSEDNKTASNSSTTRLLLQPPPDIRTPFTSNTTYIADRVCSC